MQIFLDPEGFYTAFFWLENGRLNRLINILAGRDYNVEACRRTSHSCPDSNMKISNKTGIIRQI